MKFGPNDVIIEGDMVFSRVHGVPDMEDMRKFFEMVAEVEAKYGQVLFLSDVTEGFGLTSESRRYTAEWSKNHRIVANAFFGASTPARAMLTLVLRAMSLLGNSQAHTRFFATEAESRDFLDQFRVPEFRRKGCPPSPHDSIARGR